MSNDPTQNTNLSSPTAKNAPVNEDTELEVVGAEEVFFTKRDENGDLIPKTLEVPGTDGKAVRVKPASSGVYNEYLSPVEWENDEKMAELFSKQFSDLDVSAEDLDKDLLSFSAQTMVQLIREASGEGMQSALEEKQNREGIETMMGMLGIEKGEADMADMMRVVNQMEGGTTAGDLQATAEQHDIDPDSATVAELMDAVGEGDGEGAAGPNPSPP